MTVNPTTMDLRTFNTSDDATVRPLLDGCLDIDTWVDSLIGARPFESRQALLDHGFRASAAITWDQVATALARHPRIGERASGSDAARSASEQSGVAAGEHDAFAAANRRYEERFGHIFLICASGRSGAEMLAALEQRLGNDDGTEHDVVIRELRAIAALRLEKAVPA
ncbi:2-oxo-4-hydroxy-4-carboxy-5-ureidoimidazoline decarboxylase [Nakamurella deserti]|uniref:2-oxo-4-hydroxy-4-carboxy-5-ureidoimidazoline decarboxylase n=1 Tax=Nakamurella deserti TaxID=2164074 RepID=UPI001F0BE8A1|nr:2-oxo-4-hydroxy-4-carboxy-5-ureidoimidazoline decarboxylase [Nakamurella deserti]